MLPRPFLRPRIELYVLHNDYFIGLTMNFGRGQFGPDGLRGEQMAVLTLAAIEKFL